ncbi:aspartate carbamoyltransferase [Pygmaiobacter massiliensis]|uniref:aspartate carbamoyltransferase n=1 Tax=Pygmaiobacter massiliensis TaxID=1917873 RepID=UPI002A828006|nr:aspartate carbamoyltransferase [Pygmaiobacter massiliensis]MDY4784711.1 aspartate carbamoyltransferase [Pygmaiobacter massiliensis]
MRHLLESGDLTVAETDDLIRMAEDIIAHPEAYSERCKGKKLATLFFEPSTRTRLSFEAAMYELGGNVLSVSSMASSSAAKGETMADTVRVMGCYADIIAMRHPKEGAPYAARRVAEVPIINAGDGTHHHPTQTLTDLCTIHREKGRLNDLTVVFCGDLKYGRTVHSLVKAFSQRKGIKFIFVSPEELRMPSSLLHETLDPLGMQYEEVRSMEEALAEADVLYMTRIQRERFDDMEMYEALKDIYVLTSEKMALAKSDCIVLHPLPRVNEIAVEVDADPRACYFEQVYNGKIMRMALILKLLGLDGDTAFATAPHAQKQNLVPEKAVPGKCSNPRCICTTEQGLPHLVRPSYLHENEMCCIYCDTPVK